MNCPEGISANWPVLKPNSSPAGSWMVFSVLFKRYMFPIVVMAKVTFGSRTKAQHASTLGEQGLWFFLVLKMHMDYCFFKRLYMFDIVFSESQMQSSSEFAASKSVMEIGLVGTRFRMFCGGVPAQSGLALVRFTWSGVALVPPAVLVLPVPFKAFKALEMAVSSVIRSVRSFILSLWVARYFWVTNSGILSCHNKKTKRLTRKTQRFKTKLNRNDCFFCWVSGVNSLLHWS